MSKSDNNPIVRNIPVKNIVVSPYQIRHIAGTPELDAALLELAANIKQHGLINPITVRPVPGSDKYECVAGHRRLEAVRMNDAEEIPSVYAERMEDEEAEEICVSENLYRLDLSPMEEADTVIKLLKRRTIEAVAKLYQKSERWVYRRIELDKLSTTSKVVARLYKWPAAFCEALAQHNHPEQEALIRNAAGKLGIDMAKAIDGLADKGVSPFFAGELPALTEAETVVAPRPVKKPRKTAKKAPPTAPKAEPEAEPEEEEDNAPAAKPEVKAEPEKDDECDADIRRVYELLRAGENFLYKCDRWSIAKLMISSNWINPLDADSLTALDTLWDRMRTSLMRRIATNEIQAVDVENTLNKINHIEMTSETENNENESEAANEQD